MVTVLRRKTLVTRVLLCGFVSLTMLGLSAGISSSAPPLKTFRIVAVEVDSVPLWLPSVIEVNQGDHIKLVLQNMMGGAPDVHGFTIPSYHVAVLVPHGATKTVEFTADKAGIFPFFCQIHAEHLGGQLVVHARQGDIKGE